MNALTHAERPAKIAFILIDGIGDVNSAALGGLTPLQAAATPCLDAIAAAGLCGLMDPVEAGVACGSDTAHLAILGYDPRLHYRGRGAFESLGAGLAMAPGDIAFKCNFATVDPARGVVLRRRADRRFDDLGPKLCAALDGLSLPAPYSGLTVRCRYATEHRAGLVLSGPGLSAAVTGTDPLRDGEPLGVPRPCNPDDDADGRAAYTAGAVAALSAACRARLESHPANAARTAEGKSPANVLLLRGCGARIAVPTFATRHGLAGPAMVAPTKIIAGVGITLGLRMLDAPGATGDYRTALHAKAEAAAAALSGPGCGFVFLHVKAVDDAGHDRRPGLKSALLSRVDTMIAQLIARLWASQATGGGRYILAITGDHTTPAAVGDHTAEPVPAAVAHLGDVVRALGGPQRVAATSLAPIDPPREEDSPRPPPGGPRSPASGFDELTSARGALGRFPGSEWMGLLHAYAATADNG